MKISTGSITVKRLRRGYTISLHFEVPTGVALYQGVNSSGNVAPDWSSITQDSKRPQIRPVLESTGGSNVEVVSGTAKWYYLGQELMFSTDGTCTSANGAGKFKLSTDGAYTIIIIGNLASATNDSNDTLTFKCMARSNGAKEQEVSGSIDVVISPIGAGSYTGILGITGNIIADSNGLSTGELNSTSDKIGVTMSLLYAGAQVSGFGYAIVKSGVNPSVVTVAKGMDVSIPDAITVDMVDGQSTFLVYFYPAGVTDPTKSVDCLGFSVLDTTDDFEIVYGYKNDAVQDVDDNVPVTVVPVLVRMADGAKVNITNDQWEHQVYRLQDNGTTWAATRKDTNGNPVPITTKEVVLTTADTDYPEMVNGQATGRTIQCDVKVVGTVQFELA
jgi:hypothetical protein